MLKKPPVRYLGRSFIRIDSRRDIATEAQERSLKMFQIKL